MSNPKKLTRQVVIRIEPELDDWLTLLAEVEERPKAQVIRMMLNQIRKKDQS